MAYAAMISLKRTLLGLHQGSGNFTIKEIESLQGVLEILDERNGNGQSAVEVWDLVESQMLKRFPSEYPIVQSWVKDIRPLKWFCHFTEVDASDRRIRKAVNKLKERLLSSKLLTVELDKVKQEIYSFTQTVNMIDEEEKLKKEDNQNKSKDTGFIKKKKKKKKIKILGLFIKYKHTGFIHSHKSTNDTVRLPDEFPKTMDLIREIEKCAEEVLRNLKTTVKRFDKGRSNSSRERMNDLEVQIREAACELEDLLETRVSNQLLNSQPQSLIGILPFPLNSHEEERYILPFTQLVKKLKQEYMIEMMDPLLYENENDDDDIVVSRESSSCQNKCKMVGFHNVFVKIKGHLTDSLSKLTIHKLYGMAGIGKTMAASKVFEDPSMLDLFELRVWVDVGQNYQFKRIMQSMITQVSPDNIDELLTTGDESLEGYLQESLYGRSIVVKGAPEARLRR